MEEHYAASASRPPNNRMQLTASARRAVSRPAQLIRVFGRHRDDGGRDARATRPLRKRDGQGLTTSTVTSPAVQGKGPSAVVPRNPWLCPTPD